MAKEKWYRIYIFLFLDGLRRCLLLLPERWCQNASVVFGTLAYWILKKNRNTTQKNLKQAFALNKSSREIGRIVKHVFINITKVGIDVSRFPKLTRARLEKCVQVESGSLEHLDQALSAGKGVIALTGHLGNWELLGCYLRFLGYPGKVVGRRIYYRRYDQLVRDLRHQGLISTIDRRFSVREIVRELSKNHLVGMLTDHDVDHLEGVFLPFFGKPAWTLISPAKISVATHAPIVPMFMLHHRGFYRLVIDKPLWPDLESNKNKAVYKMTVDWSHVVETYIRRYADQWTWMHNRWKSSVFRRYYSVPPDITLDAVSV
jgi:Kdo2-lipid IVA lauroyltransferase/acyltransferase